MSARSVKVLEASNEPLLDFTGLSALRSITKGQATIAIGLIDGPVNINAPCFQTANIREVTKGNCENPSATSCQHGTFLAALLCASYPDTFEGLCPYCTLIVRTIYQEQVPSLPTAIPELLASAIIEVVDAGAHVVNLSCIVTHSLMTRQNALDEAIRYAAMRGTIVVIAAGNQSGGGNVLTAHPWAIPVVACDLAGRPLEFSNLSIQIGRNGLRAPGLDILSLSPACKPLKASGTSLAAVFVTATTALLWSQFPRAAASDIVTAIRYGDGSHRSSVVPPVLNAWKAYQILADTK